MRIACGLHLDGLGAVPAAAVGAGVTYVALSERDGSRLVSDGC